MLVGRKYLPTLAVSKYFIHHKKQLKMYLTTEKKKEIFEKYGKNNTKSRWVMAFPSQGS